MVASRVGHRVAASPMGTVRRTVEAASVPTGPGPAAVVPTATDPRVDARKATGHRAAGPTATDPRVGDPPAAGPRAAGPTPADPAAADPLMTGPVALGPVASPTIPVAPVGAHPAVIAVSSTARSTDAPVHDHRAARGIAIAVRAGQAGSMGGLIVRARRDRRSALPPSMCWGKTRRSWLVAARWKRHSPLGER